MNPNPMQAIDHEAYTLVKSLPTIHFHKWIRISASEAKAQFPLVQRGGNPEFSFDACGAFDAKSYLEQLARVRQEIRDLRIHEALHELYHAQLDELALKATFIASVQNKTDAESSRIATKIFGAPSLSIEDLEREFDAALDQFEPSSAGREVIRYDAFSDAVRSLLAHYHFNHWEVTSTNEHSVRVVFPGTRGGTVLIPNNLRISPRRAKQLLAHEIETHVLRRENGLSSGINLLSKGVAGYLATEEGLAIYTQEQVAPGRYFEPGFWDAYAAALASSHSFADTYARLKEKRNEFYQAIKRTDHEQRAEASAYRLCLKTYRGMWNPDAPGKYYPRGVVYLDGHHKIKQWFDAQPAPELVALLYRGKVGLHQIPLLAELDLPAPTLPLLESKNAF